MFTATIFFMGLALCIFASLICFGTASAIKANNAMQLPSLEKATWSQIQAALVDLYSRYESRESARQKALRSWAGTLTICSGLCMIGILLEVRYNELISAKSVIGGLVGGQQVSAPVREISLPRQHSHTQKPPPVRMSADKSMN